MFFSVQPVLFGFRADITGSQTCRARVAQLQPQPAHHQGTQQQEFRFLTTAHSPYACRPPNTGSFAAQC